MIVIDLIVNQFHEKKPLFQIINLQVLKANNLFSPSLPKNNKSDRLSDFIIRFAMSQINMGLETNCGRYRRLAPLLFPKTDGLLYSKAVTLTK